MGSAGISRKHSSQALKQLRIRSWTISGSSSASYDISCDDRNLDRFRSATGSLFLHCIGKEFQMLSRSIRYYCPHVVVGHFL